MVFSYCIMLLVRIQEWRKKWIRVKCCFFVSGVCFFCTTFWNFMVCKIFVVFCWNLCVKLWYDKGTTKAYNFDGNGSKVSTAQPLQNASLGDYASQIGFCGLLFRPQLFFVRTRSGWRLWEFFSERG